MGHPVERLLHLWVVLGGEEASGEHDRASGELVQWLEPAGLQKERPNPEVHLLAALPVV